MSRTESYIHSSTESTSTGMAVGACLGGFARIAARAREPYASSDWDLAIMADRGSTTRGMTILGVGALR